jgi:hypothetical protein
MGSHDISTSSGGRGLEIVLAMIVSLQDRGAKKQ